MYDKCDRCCYSEFCYSASYQLKYVWCTKLGDRLSPTGYKHLKMCLFFKQKNDIQNIYHNYNKEE